MSLLLTLIFCLAAGFLARLIMPGPQNLDLGQTLLLGVVGGIAARAVMGLLGVEGNVGIVAGVIGAVLVLLLVNWLRKKGLM